MTRYRSWILTDTQHDIWVDSFGIGSADMPLHEKHNWSIRKRTLHGGRRDGIDLIDVSNGELAFSVLPTRGMGLWRGIYRGHALGWQSPIIGPVHPKYVDANDRGGIGWLTGFDEWLVRCGLNFNGPPGTDVRTDKSGQTHSNPVTLHGRIANIPAHYVEVRVNPDPPHELSIIGHVEEGSLFGGRLNLVTTYTTVPGSNRLVIHDVITNLSAQSAELQLLYHCNLGAPFLEAGSRVVLPIREMSPLTPRAAEGIETYETYAGPTTGYAEQVYCYDPLSDDAGRTLAMLYNKNADLGAVLRFNTKELPCFTVWKNTSAVADGYVTGLEPATNYPNFKTFEREQGRVPVISPGGHYESSWSFEVQEGSAAVAEVLSEIVQIQTTAKAQIHQKPANKFSAAGEE